MQRTLVIDTVPQVGETVVVKGWVHGRRDHGKIIFIDLRDRSGLLQVVFAPDSPQAHELAQQLRPESVVAITGLINARPAKLANDKLPTGTVEMVAKELQIINIAATPPFEIDQDTRTVGEELRFKYRYLDLRTQRMAANIRLRHKVIHFLRNYLTGQGFAEVQTPILTKSTPEGARDYLVPSRVHPGKFFALPQSPQQYKQLLMVAGIERYFQIAPCFRDEDARADRSPGEFYQLDMEMSFVEQEDILQLVEGMMTALIKEVAPEKKITQTPWPRITHAESMAKYGNDKPDLRVNKEDSNELAFCWVLQFPLFTEQTADDFFHGSGASKWAPSHHMFTAPHPDDVHLLETDPGKVKSLQHDLAMNGLELGGGSIRIHDPKVQEKIFDLIGFSAEQKKQFDHLLEAFSYGVPPHGGIAPGIDRFVSLLAGEDRISEVIAFPLSGKVRDLMMGAPTEVAAKQLQELHIRVITPESKPQT